MGTRLQLQDKFETIINSRNVYFQPPESIKIQYPCIIYKLDEINILHSDNLKYRKVRGYFVQYISKDPDTTVIDSILEMPYSSFVSRTIVDGLYHNNFKVFN